MRTRQQCEKPRTRGTLGGSRLGWVPVIVLLAIPAMGAFELPRFLTVWGKPAGPGVAFAGSPSMSPATDSRNVAIEEIARLAPQQQAERLLELAANDDRKSLELIRQNLPNWHGRLQNTDQLFDAVLKALRSDDLRVRTAAVEIDLSANHLSQTPESLAWLQQVIRKDAARRSMALWRLGALGNRGVEPKAVLNTLVLYAHHVNLDTRYWAVEGLAMLATDEAIDPLLDVLRHDPSSRVRERAASALAQSGLFRKEQRVSAVPHLLNSLDDDGLDAKTRGCVLWTLRTITGAAIGDDINAWREWWANHDGAPRRLSSRPGFYRI
jgi:hypothetical protein